MAVQQRKNAPQVSTAKLKAALFSTKGDLEQIVAITGLKPDKVKTRVKSLAVKMEEIAATVEDEVKKAALLKNSEVLMALPFMKDQRGRKGISHAELAEDFGAALGIELES